VKYNKKALALLILALVLTPLLSGCYLNKQVEAHEVGVKMDDGVSITAIVGPGRYSSGSWFAELTPVNVSAKTVIWEDPDLVTQDKQPIGFSVAVTYARSPESDDIADMWTRYHAEAVHDASLQTLVLARLPRVAKAVTTQYTLDEMLADRNQIQAQLEELLLAELEEANVVLLDVGINNIAPSPSYLALLEEKAAAQIAVEVARERTKELEERLNQEIAQTEIDMELARRQNQVNEEMARGYQTSPEIYELERMRILGTVIGNNDKIVVVPEGAALNLFTGDGMFPAVQTGEKYK
jgi:regulator of protease activity HflC (stomatin/prohibitin superfamily)